MRKIPKFYLIFWHENFVKTQIFCRVSSDLLKILQKVFVSRKFLYQEVRFKYGTLNNNCAIAMSHFERITPLRVHTLLHYKVTCFPF